MAGRDRAGREEKTAKGTGGSKVARSEADGVVTLTLSNPPANALDDETIGLLRTLLSEIASRPTGIGCVVLTGAGSRFFSAGGDVKELSGMTPKAGIARVRAFLAMIEEMERLEMPVVCSVNGDAVGAGTELCLFADYRVGVAYARFGLPEVNHGLLPAARSVQQTVRVIGLREARRLLFEGRLIGAEEAARIGVIDAVARDGEELGRMVRRWADEMARKPRTLMGPLKRTMALTGQLSDEELLQMCISDFRRYFGDPEARGKLRELIDRWKRPDRDPMN